MNGPRGGDAISTVMGRVLLEALRDRAADIHGEVAMASAISSVDEAIDLIPQIEVEAASGLREALEDIYNDSRMFGYLADGSGGPGVCRWCEAPPADADHDHDVACPAAKARRALWAFR